MIAMTISSSSSVNAGLPIRIWDRRGYRADKVEALAATRLMRECYHPASASQRGIQGNRPPPLRCPLLHPGSEECGSNESLPLEANILIPLEVVIMPLCQPSGSA